MRIPFLQPRHREFVVGAARAADLAAVAAIHQGGFRPAMERGGIRRPAQPGHRVRLLRPAKSGMATRDRSGFVLARLVAGEAEILTVAVARSHRRLGLGWLLMDAVLRDLHTRRADALFLEVDESNTPAITLYRRLGFRQVGRRPDYYARRRWLRRPARSSCAAIFASAASGFGRTVSMIAGLPQGSGPSALVVSATVVAAVSTLVLGPSNGSA